MSILSKLVSLALVAPLALGATPSTASSGVSPECYNYIGIKQHGGFTIDRLTLEAVTGIYPPGAQLWTKETYLPLWSTARVHLGGGRVWIGESARLRASVFWGAWDVVGPEIFYCPNGRTAWLSMWGTAFSPQIGWS